MALSDFAVRQAKTTGKDYTLGDTDGLTLSVSAAGGKAWHFRYYWAGKQKRMSLGTYPEVSLREARALRDEARALLKKGINPRIHRKQKLRAVRLADEARGDVAGIECSTATARNAGHLRSARQFAAAPVCEAVGQVAPSDQSRDSGAPIAGARLRQSRLSHS